MAIELRKLRERLLREKATEEEKRTLIETHRFEQDDRGITLPARVFWTNKMNYDKDIFKDEDRINKILTVQQKWGITPNHHEINYWKC